MEIDLGSGCKLSIVDASADEREAGVVCEIRISGDTDGGLRWLDDNGAYWVVQKEHEDWKVGMAICDRDNKYNHS
jgi:hypothetical protein